MFSPTSTDLIGYIAMSLTTAAFAPQALHTLKTRDVSGISLAMYLSFTVGVALWLVYGLLRSDWPIIIGNTITLGLALVILVLKLRYGGNAQS